MRDVSERGVALFHRALGWPKGQSLFVPVGVFLGGVGKGRSFEEEGEGAKLLLKIGLELAAHLKGVAHGDFWVDVEQNHVHQKIRWAHLTSCGMPVERCPGFRGDVGGKVTSDCNVTLI